MGAITGLEEIFPEFKDKFFQTNVLIPFGHSQEGKNMSTKIKLILHLSSARLKCLAVQFGTFRIPYRVQLNSVYQKAVFAF